MTVTDRLFCFSTKRGLEGERRKLFVGKYIAKLRFILKWTRRDTTVLTEEADLEAKKKTHAFL